LSLLRHRANARRCRVAVLVVDADAGPLGEESRQANALANRLRAAGYSFAGSAVMYLPVEGPTTVSCRSGLDREREALLRVLPGRVEAAHDDDHFLALGADCVLLVRQPN
jgi:hypothetical protein